jgi:hypothetical protein
MWGGRRGTGAAARPAVRRGIVLPAVLAALVSLALLSSLALFDAVQEWRVAGLAGDQVLARAAMHEGVDRLATPDDLAALCVSPPLLRQGRSARASGGGRFALTWSHLGGGLVRAEVQGVGRHGARARAIALMRPDASEWVTGLFRCPAATQLEPVGAGWVTSHPEG